jgi:hypothetical protein
MNDTESQKESEMSYFLVELETANGKAILPMVVYPQDSFLESLKDSLASIPMKANAIGSTRIDKRKFDELYLLSIT